MKLAICLLGLLFSFSSFANTNVVTLESINQLEIANSAALRAMIDWKVGDAQDYKVTLGGFPMEGTMRKEAFAEEGNAVWVRQEMKLQVMNDKSEMLLDRNTGKILKFVHNGKEQAAPQSDIEIISTKSETVEVPAGKFKVLYVKAKSKDVKDIQMWVNPRDISLDGAAKVYMDQGMVKITMVLTKFVKN